MTSQLPANPNLRHLRHQAKDLHKAHKNGDASCCQALRHLRQFADRSDEDILSASISLVQAQFALAMEYGFDDWPQLRRHVQSSRDARGGEGQVVLQTATGQLAHVRSTIRDYEQPHLDVETQCVCMRAAGWSDVDYDILMTVSGASLLFGYHHNDVAPAYAFTHIGVDERIAQATGYESEWFEFKDAEDAWNLVRTSIDSGCPVRGHCEGYYIVIMGYQDNPTPEQRRLFQVTNLSDEKWWDWDDFLWWAGDRDTQSRINRHSKEVATADEKSVALQVLQNAVDWSDTPPDRVKERLSHAELGLAGIRAYADDLADVDGKPADYFASYWRGCYAINAQWTARNSTSVYLGRLAATNTFPAETNEHVLAASKKYREAYVAWQGYDRQLGHGAPDEDERSGAWNVRETRLAGANAVRDALKHEQEAIACLKQALSTLGVRGVTS